MTHSLNSQKGMEEIYVIRVRSATDPSRLYPSERRYSASTVAGLGAIHLLLAITLLLLGSLGQILEPDGNQFGGGIWLGLSAAASGIAGMLAWRRWYIDTQIHWFFAFSLFSSLASLLCIGLTGLSMAMLHEARSDLVRNFYQISSRSSPPPTEIKTVVATNVLVASAIEFVWSLLSAKIAWKGMTNTDEDAAAGALDWKKKKVSTTLESRRTPDIISQLARFPGTLPVSRVNPLGPQGQDLPSESTLEYQERVNKFLNSTTSPKEAAPDQHPSLENMSKSNHDSLST